MKRKLLLPIRLAMLLVFAQLMGCNKFDFDDLWHKHNPGCRIEKIIAHNQPFLAETQVADFTYNQKGDPELVTFSTPGTGRPHLRFFYDKGRLSAYVGTYSLGPNAGYEFYFQYYYDNKNRIVADTLYGLGDVENGVPKPHPALKSWADYEYDVYNRVKKVSRYFWVNAAPMLTQQEEYFYNEDGNLSRTRSLTFSGPVETMIGPYDNKINMNQTNKVWMFVQQNYSRNNVVPATAHNKSQLPTRYQLPYDQGRGFLYQFNIADSEIFYDCKK